MGLQWFFEVERAFESSAEAARVLGGGSGPTFGRGGARRGEASLLRNGRGGDQGSKWTLQCAVWLC